MIFVNGYNEEGMISAHYIAEPGITDVAELIEEMKSRSPGLVKFTIAVQDCE